MNQGASIRSRRLKTCAWLAILCNVAFFMATPSAHGMAPPIREDLISGELPPYPFYNYDTDPGGRIYLTGDSSVPIVDNDIPEAYSSTASTSNEKLVRGNYYRCDKGMQLHRQSILLGRSSSSPVDFVVYESTEESGTYSLVASKSVVAAIGTNMVSSGDMDTLLVAGRYYILGAAWDENCQCYWASSTEHPVQTEFGESLHGYFSSGYPPPAATVGSDNDNVYIQTLELRTNLVMCMDNDKSIPYGYATNFMSMLLNLQDYTDVTLSFRHRENDETDSADGVFLSTDDGSTFHKIHDLAAGPNWQTITIDLDAAATSNGLVINGTTHLKFQQYDNQDWPYDGHEFDDIHIYSRPDLIVANLATTPGTATNLWRGFQARTIPLNFETTSRSGNEDLYYPDLAFRFTLEDGGSTLVSHDDTHAWSFPALCFTNQAMAKSFSIPGGTYLDKNSYTITAVGDWTDLIDEEFENNNSASAAVVINHYSGTLWFDNLETSITITDWSRTSDTDHTISGTGTLEDYPFSFNNLRVLKNSGTLDYSIHPEETQSILLAMPDRREVGNVYYWLPSGIYLSRIGGYANITVRMPAGLAIAAEDTYLMESTLNFGGRKLSQGLYPDSSITIQGPFFVNEETKPLNYKVQDASWNPLAGEFQFPPEEIRFTRLDDLDKLSTIATNEFQSPDMAKKRSNAQYYRFVGNPLDLVVVRAASGKDARLSTSFWIGSGDFMPHFPYGSTNEWVAYESFFEITDDLISGTSELAVPQHFKIPYARTCPTNKCADDGRPTRVSMTPYTDATFSKDGGIRLPVTLSAIDVRWGRNIAGSFAQEALNHTSGTYYMPGHFIRGDQSLVQVADNLGPGVILLSGSLPGSDAMERPRHYSGQEDYRSGFADYAGLNLRCGANGDHAARCTLGGTQTDTWLLTGRSKYYLRLSGVSGIHEAVYQSFPETLEIYGYQHDFDNYGLSFLSGEPEESRINGLVSLVYPSNFDIEYEKMRIDCMGEIVDANVDNAPDKKLDYWNAIISPGSLFYKKIAGDSCASGKRALCLGITTKCANIEQTLAGILGFLNTGEIAAGNDQVENVDSRLGLPNLIELDGPSDEIYGFTPILSAYYNDYGESGNGTGDEGWINLAGALDVAFFEDMNVLFHTSASTNSATAPIYMTGGFVDGLGHTFVSNAKEFDAKNAGFPHTVVTSVDDFRNPSSVTYRALAKKAWLEGIDFEYPLAWSTASKSFYSPEAVTSPVLVVNIQHQTDYLSTEKAELSFGKQYDGLPQLNTANMAINAIDESTGMAQAFAGGAGEEISGTIRGGLGAFDNMLTDLPEKLFGPILAETIDPIIDTLYTKLSIAYLAAPGSDYYSTLVSNYVGGGQGIRSVEDALKGLIDGTGFTTNLPGDLDRGLEQVVRAIDAFTGEVKYDPLTGEELADPVTGLLNVPQGTPFEALGNLAASILGTLSSDLANTLAAELQPKLNQAILHFKPALDTTTEYLGEVRGTVVGAQAQLNSSSGRFHTELQDALDSGQINTATTAAVDKINARFGQMAAAGNLFTEYTEQEIKTMIRKAIDDQFYASPACHNIQQVIRSRLYDVQAALNTAIDGVFQQLNLAMRRVASEYITAIDEEIVDMLGDLSDVMGSGQLNGYAHIKHDSLTELRLDGIFQWQVPAEMEFPGYLIIRQLNADGSASCGMPGGKAPEVTIQCDDVDLNWLGSDLQAKINTKFSFSNSPVEVIGLAGSFELTDGEISFESFVINDLYAAVAFGQFENYLSASVRCKMSGYEVAGGVFFGRTCSLSPFSWDPDVQSILGEPPFTGVYVYGEGWIPIVDFGCFLQVKAGVGAGIFAFLEGPVGGKILLGAEGEALCVVGIRGEITLSGIKNGDIMRLRGRGRLSGKLGWCPFCIKYGKSVVVVYENGSFDVYY